MVTGLLSDVNSCPFPLLDFLHFPLLLLYEDDLAWIFVFVFCVLFFSSQRKDLFICQHFHYFTFNLALIPVIHPYDPVYSEKTYNLLIRGRGQGERINEAEHPFLFPL